MPQFKIIEKNNKKFVGILRRLAKSDSSIMNGLKVTVYKEKIIEEKKQIFIAPSIFNNYLKCFNNYDSAENTSENINEDSVVEEIQSSNDTEQMDYPDSSDFDDDDD